ncbi:hypothetical protein K9N50_05475 [bacterium]|nr:hypothetical protein [bacterium]
MTKEQSALLKKATDSLRAARLLEEDGITDIKAHQQISRAEQFLEFTIHFIDEKSDED